MYEGVQKLPAPTKNFFDETRCQGLDVIKMTPDADTSQSVMLFFSGCCSKNVCYFCGTQRRPAGRGDSVHGVTEECGKGFPLRFVGNTESYISYRSFKARIVFFPKLVD